MLSCVPALFGLPLARVSHPICAGDGGDSCVYDVSWEAGGAWARFALGCIAAAGALLAGAGISDASLLPEAGVAAAALVGVGTHRVIKVRARAWRQLESEARDQSLVTQRLNASLQDIVSELRLEDVLAKVTANAQSTLEGKHFALLVDDGDGLRCRRARALGRGLAPRARLPARARGPLHASRAEWVARVGRAAAALAVRGATHLPGRVAGRARRAG
jgi:hypothetical protein